MRQSVAGPVLITGYGFIGRAVSDLLVSRGVEVTILDRHPDIAQCARARVRPLAGDIRDASLLQSLVPEFAGVIHTAAILGTSETVSDPAPSIETNILGSVHLFQALRRAAALGRNIPCVYITCANWFMDNAYAITKHAAHRFAQMFNREHGADIRIVRMMGESPFVTVALVTFVVSMLIGPVWCRYLCPLGTLLSVASRLRIVRRSVTAECTHCGKCVRDCPVGAIPEKRPEHYRRQDCIHCFTCLACPPKAVSFALRWPMWKGSPELGVDLSRRYVLGSLCLGGFSALMIKTNPLQTESGMRNNRLIRPPGALPEEEFVSVCTGCGECLKVCPNNALQSTLLEAGLAGLYTPRLVPRIGYCEEFCNFCGRVCPTEAIRPTTIEEKRLLQMGVAHINKTRCIAWDTDKICLVCNEQCSYHAIVGDEKKRPIVKEDRCTGCGICENKCPVEGEAAIVVYSSGIQKKLKPEPENNNPSGS